MAQHTSEFLWGAVRDIVSPMSDQLKRALIDGEEQYQELLELYNYAGGTNQLLADQLFSDLIEGEGRNPAEANASEVARTADLVAAMTAIHDLYLLASNNVVAQGDRLAALRRMS